MGGDEPDICEALFESRHVLIAVLDRDFRFVRVNQAYSESVSRSAESLIGLGHFDLYPHAENESIFRGVLETGLPYRVSAKPFVHPDQPQRPITYWDWTLSAVRDAAGGHEGLLLQLVDVTDRIILSKLAAAGQLRLREVHHRVKNNLQIVTAFLREVTYQHPETRATIDQALSRVGAIATLHETLMRPGDTASIDLVRYAEAVVSGMDQLRGKDGIAITVSGEASVPTDVATSIGLILQELITNATRHAFRPGETGKIDVSIRHDDTHLFVEVCDDGMGSSAHRETSHGIELVRGLTEQLEGEFESHALTPRGTCCHVWIPKPLPVRDS